jgi:hypothetical protein
MFYVIGNYKSGEEYREPARNVSRVLLIMERSGSAPHTIEGDKPPSRLPAALREFLERHKVTYRIIGSPDALRDAEKVYQAALARLQNAREELTEAENNYSALFERLH